MPLHCKGERSRRTNESQWWVNSHGWMARVWGTLSSTALRTAKPAVAAMAPTGASASVGTNRPMLANPSSEAATMPAAAKVRKIPSSKEMVVPDRVTTWPTGKRMTPAMSPPRATAMVAARQNTATVAALVASRRVRPDGRVSRYRRVPRLASPAMASPDTTATTSGRKNVMATVRPASAANMPLCDTWSRNVGPRPDEGPPDRRTATASAAGMAASTARRTLTRMRRKSVASSANNIEPLPGEGDERVLERGTDSGETAYGDAGQNELAVAVLGSVAVEAGEHGRPFYR